MLLGGGWISAGNGKVGVKGSKVGRRGMLGVGPEFAVWSGSMPRMKAKARRFPQVRSWPLERLERDQQALFVL